jgi:hypothetical protein
LRQSWIPFLGSGSIPHINGTLLATAADYQSFTGLTSRNTKQGQCDILVALEKANVLRPDPLLGLHSAVDARHIARNYSTKSLFNNCFCYQRFIMKDVSESDHAVIVVAIVFMTMTRNNQTDIAPELHGF